MFFKKNRLLFLIVGSIFLIQIVVFIIIQSYNTDGTTGDNTLISNGSSTTVSTAISVTTEIDSSESISSDTTSSPTETTSTVSTFVSSTTEEPLLCGSTDFDKNDDIVDTSSISFLEEAVFPNTTCGKVIFCDFEMNQTCTTTVEELNQYIKNMCDSNCTCEIQATNIIFPNNTVKQGWLEPSLKINHLHIANFDLNSSCVTIQKGALNFSFIEDLQRITITDLFSGCKNFMLTNDMLSGLENVNTLYFFNPSSPIAFERHLFKDMNMQVLYILFSFQNSSAISDILGTSDHFLHRLKYIDFSYNYYVEDLHNYSFVSAQNVTEIHLAYCNIKFIEGRAFAGLNKLKRVNLEHNRLKIISDEPFELLQNCIVLNLDLNPLDCDCDHLKWLNKTKFEDISSNQFPSCIFGPSNTPVLISCYLEKNCLVNVNATCTNKNTLDFEEQKYQHDLK